jgi:hypothetical protein
MHSDLQNGTKPPEADVMKRRWQFSLRALLIAMTLVSIVLAVAVKQPLLFWIAVVATSAALGLQGIAWIMTFATSRRRPLIATVAWFLFGVFFVLMAAVFATALYSHVGEEPASPVWIAGLLVPGACALRCFYESVRMLID